MTCIRILFQNLPFKRAKHGSSSSRTTHATSASTVEVSPQDGNGEESSKPEDHSDDLCCEDAEFMGSSRELCWCDDQVGEDEKGPDRGKEEKVFISKREWIIFLNMMFRFITFIQEM